MHQQSKKIIGGVFGLDLTDPYFKNSPPFLDEKNIFLANGRSGIDFLVRELSPRQVWMPSYLCGTMLEGIKHNDFSYRFYAVDYDLKFSHRDWLDAVGENDLVVFIEYFGFPCESSVLSLAKSKRAWVLVDACQALLSKRRYSDFDFLLFSPRKFLGVPDGGILCSNKQQYFGQGKLQMSPDPWWFTAFEATALRGEFDRKGGDRRWFQLFRKADIQSPVGNYAMSEFSKRLLSKFDYRTIARKRAENFRFLASELGKLALFPKLPSDVVPLGFPIRTEYRDRLRQVLFGENIYPPVHWAIKGVVPERFEDSHRLSEDIMTLPCDQRYEIEDMRRMTALVLQETKKQRMSKP